MNDKRFFSVGEASKLCNVSKKTLRFYDEIGIISPDRIGENDYRYYSKDTLLAIPVIKYYKQMGFKLDEMREFISGGTYANILQSFKHKIQELNAGRAKLARQHTSISGWYDLILEAGVVIDCNVTEVGVKFFDSEKYLFWDQPYNPDYRDAIINIEFTNYIDSIGNAITGPVIRQFDSFRDKMKGTCETQRMLQKTIMEGDPDRYRNFGGGVMLSCYHIGTYEKLNETYDKMLRWAADHGYKCGASAYERYVVDYWTTSDVSQHVAEIMIDVSR